VKKYHYLDWDRKNIVHIAKHRITPEEVEQVVFSTHSLKRKGKGSNVYYVLGQTDNGRYLFVVLRDFKRNFAYVITAREMSNSEKKWFNKR